MKINPPDLKKCKTFERYILELEAWHEVTDLAAEKQGIAIALSLPQDSAIAGIREKVFDEIKLADLKKQDGLDTLIKFLEKAYGKDDLTDSWDKFEEFEDFSRGRDQKFLEYISNFEQKYNRLKKVDIELPSSILAFKLLRRANITQEERLLVLSGMDFSKKDTLFDQAISSLKKFKGERGGSGVSGHTSGDFTPSIPVKLEPALVVEEDEHEEAYMAGGYRQAGGSGGWRGQSGGSSWRSGSGGGWRGNSWRGNSWRGGSGEGSRGNWRGASGYVGNNSRGAGRGNASSGQGGNRGLNPVGADGNLKLCVACGSFRHLVAGCPDSWENRGRNSVSRAEEGKTEKAVLFTGQSDLSDMNVEGRNCAVLDSACSSTVCGRNWMKCYLDSLDAQDKAQVKVEPGTKWFKFGGGERLQSEGFYTIPAVVAGREVFIRTDVVASDIPLLLSMNAMKEAQIKLDMASDSAEIYGVHVVLNHTSSGHYAIPIDKTKEVLVEAVCAVRLEELDNKERYRALLKLHRQFAHPVQPKLIALMRDAGAWSDEFEKDLDAIYSECEICRVYKRTPDRPSVAMPMASRFNEKVCMDLKKWGDKWILHMIDMFTRFSVSVFISRKRPSDVIDKVMKCWVGAGFGVMQAVLTDNGGEFSSDETREFASILDVRVCTTAANSPFQNGLCERNHAVVDMMLLKLQEQCPNTDIEVLLAWANMAKNSLQMWHGYSSYQLVFGQNPNLPNVMTDGPPALEGTTTSEVLARHLNALHEARRSFIQSESDERIRRALRGKVRSSEQVFNHGDAVYYKREGHERWLGPARVVFQDSKVVFVRHGGVFVRVSPNRLMKATNTSEVQTLSDPLRGEEFESQPVTSSDNSTIDDNVTSEHSLPQQDESASSEFSEVIGSAPLGRDERQERERVDQQGTDREIPGVQVRQQIEEKCPRKDDKILFRDKPEEEWISATVLGRAGKATGQYKHWFNVREDSGLERCLDFQGVSDWKPNEADVNLVLIPRNRHGETECHKAKQVELEKLRHFDTYQEVDDIGQTRISTTWVLCQKGDQVRARLVARGYEETESYRKDSPTVCKSTVRVLLSIAASMGWIVKTTDIKSAFLQGRKLDRRVFLKPPKEAGVAVGKIWELKHCLYGLNDAAREFYFSVVEAMMKFGCKQSGLDPALFYFMKDGKLIGLMASHVDDFLHAGDEVFERAIMERVRSRFVAGKLEVAQFAYVGFQVVQGNTGILMDQKEYMQGLEGVEVSPQRALQKKQLLTSSEQTHLRELVGRINWAVQGSRPDIGFDMVELSTRFHEGKVEDLTRAMKIIRRLKVEDASVVFPSLGEPSRWKIVVFTDAAHANICDGLGSVGAHAVFLCNPAGRCCPLSWQACKLKRVVTSSLAAEALSLQEGLKSSIYLKHILCEIMNVSATSLPIVAYVDNKGLVEAVHSTRLVSDKQLRINIGAIKDSMKSEIEAVHWIPGQAQIVDCMTKRGASGLQLLSVLQSGRLELPAGH